jgi:hypothetical protein
MQLADGDPCVERGYGQAEIELLHGTPLASLLAAARRDTANLRDVHRRNAEVTTAHQGVECVAGVTAEVRA